MNIPENIYTTSKRTIAWAYERNLIDGSMPKDQLAKLIQELGEVSDAICKDDRHNIVEEIGDMIVVLTILCEMYDTSIPECAEVAYNKIKDRKGVMFAGVFVKETDPEYMDIVDKLGIEVLSK
jgi:NTP pyrophosphatase (non-canonical NTP hydrolase)